MAPRFWPALFEREIDVDRKPIGALSFKNAIFSSLLKTDELQPIGAGCRAPYPLGIEC